MATTNQNFSMYQNTSFNLIAPITDDNNNPLNLAGCTIEWGLRQRMSSTTNLILLTTPAGITTSGNTLTVHIAPVNSASLKGLFFHECKMTDTNGNVSTLFTGQATILASAL